MKRLITASLVLAFFVFGGLAQAKTPTQAHIHRYLSLYHQVAHKFGHRAPGRQIVKYGLVHRKATDADVVLSAGVLERMLVPPPIVIAAAPTSAVPSTTSTSGACGGITPYSGGGQCWAIPWNIVNCESGGQNVPNATGSPATGYYQIEGGGGSGSKASQDAAAHAMWQASNTGPWTASQHCWGSAG